MEVIVAIVAALAAIVAATLAFVNGRRTNSIDAFEANLALTKYIDQRVEERVRPLLLRMSAFVRILRSIARQWPVDLPPPVLDADDIRAVAEAIPDEWLPKPEAKNGGKTNE